MDGDQTVAVYENGAVKYWNILANGVVGRRTASGETLYYVKDHLGYTRAVVDEAGNVNEALDYAKDIPSGLPVWASNARQGLPERQRDKGEVYREIMG